MQPPLFFRRCAISGKFPAPTRHELKGSDVGPVVTQALFELSERLCCSTFALKVRQDGIRTQLRLGQLMQRTGPCLCDLVREGSAAHF